MKLIYTTNTSDYYYSKTGVVKVFQRLDTHESVLVEMQLKLMKEKTNLNSFCMIPKTIIYERNKVYGYQSELFEIDDSLQMWCLKNNKLKKIDMFKRISKYLRLIHQNNIVLNDFALNGVIISNNKPYFIEMDRSIIDGFDRFSLTGIMLKNNNVHESYINNKINHDIESLIIHFLRILDIDICTLDLPDIKQILKINNIPDTFINKVINVFDTNIKQVTYLDELINDTLIKSLKL